MLEVTSKIMLDSLWWGIGEVFWVVIGGIGLGLSWWLFKKQKISLTVFILVAAIFVAITYSGGGL